MRAGLAASEVGIVHGGKIVEDERGGVRQLDTTREGQHDLERAGAEKAS